MTQSSFLLHILQLFVEFVVIAVSAVLYFSEKENRAITEYEKDFNYVQRTDMR